MPRQRLLVAALAVALTGEGVPTEIRLLPAGRFTAGDGSGRPEGVPGWLLDDAAAARLVAQANARQSDYVIDFEHQTIHAEQNGQPAPAAGWFKALAWRPGDGLYAVGVRWTEKAAAMIAAGEYRYLSPVFAWDKATGVIRRLYHAGLTNNPGLDGLTDLSALTAHFEEEPLMKELLKALGLPETATEAEALAALAALKSRQDGEVTALKAQLGQAPDPTKYVAVAVLTGVQAELATAHTELAALKSAQSAAEVDQVVADAKAAGKITPATEAWAKDLGKKDLAALKSFVEAAPAVVKPGETQSGGKPPAGGVDAGSADSIAQAAMKYQAEQQTAGISITAAQAVAHVTKGA